MELAVLNLKFQQMKWDRPAQDFPYTLLLESDQLVPNSEFPEDGEFAYLLK